MTTNSVPTISRTYRGNNGTKDFQEDAAQLAGHGYTIASQVQTPGHRTMAASFFLFAGVTFLVLGLFALPLMLVGAVCLVIGLVSGKSPSEMSVVWTLSAAATERTKVCPRCAETIKAAANVCRFCGYEYVWTPSHRVPDGGMPAWTAPDPSLPPGMILNGGVELIVAERAADWARVEAVNGWTGWVDFRRLVSSDTPSSIPGEATSSEPGALDR